MVWVSELWSRYTSLPGDGRQPGRGRGTPRRGRGRPGVVVVVVGLVAAAAARRRRVQLEPGLRQQLAKYPADVDVILRRHLQQLSQVD